MQAAVARAIRAATSDDTRLRAELASARRAAGLSLADAGRPGGLSRYKVARIERGRAQPTLAELAALGAVLGLDVRLRAYPAGDPIRDAGQQRLLARFRERLHPKLGWRAEVPLPIEGDRRAWDGLIVGPGWRLAVEAETVLDDLQALERRLELKRRDGREAHVLLLIADTRTNRRILASSPGAFAGYSRATRATLRALGRGEDPGMDCLVIR
jgi:transcriptional regulator with XRE-family HTH domain